MPKYLFIVESPGKVRKLSHILGSDYHVLASLGHVRDLPTHELGIDLNNHFTPRYEVLPAKKQAISRIKEAAKKAELVYLATDPDREGEAIAWHLRQLLPKSIRTLRVTFDQITESALVEALNTPRDIDQPLVEAQTARRIIDRLAGYQVSPLLQQALGQKHLSAGRVQSATLKLVVERERERRAFQTQIYWTLYTQLEHTPLQGHSQMLFWARLTTPLTITSRQDIEFINLALPKAEEWWVEEITSEEDLVYPAPPFTTSTFQQEAARALGLSPDGAMAAAQTLYESGAITYMRTDSAHVAPEAQQLARQAIINLFGEEYLPQEPPRYHSRSGAQEAHEAIRPTDPALHPKLLAAQKAGLSDTELSIYDLVWKRFIASQMKPARYQVTTAAIRCGRRDEPLPYRFTARARVQTFAGFEHLYQEAADQDEAEEDEERGLRNAALPPMHESDAVAYYRHQAFERKTKPPQGYTPARLVAAMELKGIGRPSTYAPTLKLLQERSYLELSKRQLRPTPLGEQVHDWLNEHFPDAFNVPVTAEMEKALDEITTGQQEQGHVITDFHTRRLKPSLDRISAALNTSQQTPMGPGEPCPKCGSPLRIKVGKHGPFISCSRYPACTYSRSTRATTPPDQIHVVI